MLTDMDHRELMRFKSDLEQMAAEAHDAEEEARAHQLEDYVEEASGILTCASS